MNSFEKLEQLCDLIVDCPHSTPKWTNSGYLVIRNQNIIDDILDFSNPSYTDQENYQYRVRRVKPTVGDIVITREAPMGRVCLIPENVECCLGQRQVLLRPNTNLIDNNYLYWALKSPFVQAQIMLNDGTGATVSNMRIPALKALKIPRLGLKREKKISTFLSILNKKIQLNTQINQTLEQIAQTIFKSWFIDFDPVRAKADALANGATSEQANLCAMQIISGKSESELNAWQTTHPTEYQQLYKLAEAFPSEFDSVDGVEVPKEWRVEQLSEQFDFISGSQPPKSQHIYQEQSGYERFIQNRDYANDNHKTYIPISKKNKLCEDKDILMDKYGEAGKVRYGIKGAYNVALAKIVPKKENMREFLRWYFMQENIKSYLSQASMASTRNSLNSSTFMGMEVDIPNDEILIYFENMVSQYIDRSLQIKRENNFLSELRDYLLPKLLNGEIKL
ncbi:restriction endonuclease subunit S [Moraxella marmotae]|uniref:restriction endonuclease subunit S n=1 Tax=Moraxella marmotae TaxID=3344520 RepID=UPI0035F4D74E